MERLTKQSIYKELKKALSLALADDDLMKQDTLFALQDQLARLTLMVAQDCGERELGDLVGAFPYLYRRG